VQVVSFNVNGLRSRLHQLQALVDRYSPDIVGLQETKVEDTLFPLAEIHNMGYEAAFHGQKGHYGVALLYRRDWCQHVLHTTQGFPEDGEDAQRRLIRASFETGDGLVHVYNGYFPQGESRDHPVKFPAKKAFYKNLLDHLGKIHQPEERIIVLGDMNIAPLDTDIGIGDDNRKRWLKTGKCCFLPEERQWLQLLLDWGLEDTYNRLNPEAGEQRYSWFDYRSRGFEREPRRGLRIDLVLASRPLMSILTETGIDHEIRAMTRPSDHCPVWARFSCNRP